MTSTGRIGGVLEPISKLAGFDWRTNIALVGGFAAKEVVVSTLGTAYSLGEVAPDENVSLADRLAAAPGWSPAVALNGTPAAADATMKRATSATDGKASAVTPPLRILARPGSTTLCVANTA